MRAEPAGGIHLNQDIKEYPDTKALDEKYKKLREYIKSLRSVAVAFSGGVDSTFLLKAAHDVLGSRAVAVTASSCSFPERELNEARSFCRENGIEHIVCVSEELDIDGFRQNPLNRCYLCKHELFEKIQDIAAQKGLESIIEGSNMDDMGDYRPGLRAIEELGVKSPLRRARLTKDEIRALSRKLGLATWDKPSFACLASRFVYGETISEEKLGMVDRAEQLMLDLGFRQVRVRMHDMTARIEVLPEDIQRAAEPKNRDIINTRFKEYGFKYITLDLAGYRTGSMNEALTDKERNQ